MPNLHFYSATYLERNLDGSDERFAEYYFAIYHCSPDENAGINELREKLRHDFPKNHTAVGRHFVLAGFSAFVALTAYYKALSKAETLSDDFRAYAAERVQVITKAHQESQSLGVDLTEGQLSHDHRLELLTCIAIQNGQVVIGSAEE